MKVCFFTVCGGGEDYEFLLGSIEHHAKMGLHVVLDTTPAESAKKFEKLKRIRSSVIWIHEPIYGSGWREFKFRAALTRAWGVASSCGVDVVAQLDCDEFFSENAVEDLFPKALEAVVSVETVHWMRDGKLHSFGQSEHHARLWPSYARATWPVNQAWVFHPEYNGNPDHHAIVRVPGMEAVRVEGVFHHHVHYAIGQKALDDETARTTIQGWPNGKVIPGVPWPVPLARWKRTGVKPSEGYL